MTPVAAFPPEAACGVVTVLAGPATRGHADADATRRDADGIVRAQNFEQGPVHMPAAPFPGFDADRYLMDFCDVRKRDLCSRMMTGPSIQILVSALSPIEVRRPVGVPELVLDRLEDELAVDDGPASVQPRRAGVRMGRHPDTAPDGAPVQRAGPSGGGTPGFAVTLMPAEAGGGLVGNLTCL